MNLQSLQAELRRIERRRAKLESQYEARKAAQFMALPARVGLKSVDALIVSLAEYASPRLRSRIGQDGASLGVDARGGGRGLGKGRSRAARRGRVAAGRGPGRRGRPSQYSDETKNAIRRDLEKGGMTGAALAKKYGISRSSIKDWKSQWGLTKARKKK